MGLKCRLLGHTYADPEVQRSREEQGDEVIVTIREVQVCERCGAEQVVSQNKEVTAIRTPEEVGLGGTAAGGTDPEPAHGAQPSSTAGSDGEPSAEERASSAPANVASADAEEAESVDSAADADAPDASTAAADAEAEEATETDASDPASDGPIGEAEAETDGWETGSDDWEDVEADPDANDAVILGETDTERDETQWPEDSGPDPANAAQQSQAAESGEAATDEQVTNDAEIIDGTDDVEPRERGHGEWPERDEASDSQAEEAGSSGWPDPKGEDEGFDATADVEDDVEFQGNGLTPEVNGRAALDDDGTVQGIAADGEHATSRAHRQAREDDGFARARESTTLESDVPDDRVEFYCPNCGHANSAGASSMRAGDICPECKRGYIAERER
ncbi:DUF7093 family protein [Halobellus captivus]|uniref:DUF7093 family protein n=1 Tax=Halobellus captivus TaxID=2592614 RepID=UPI0011AA0A55|nr:hypothetical protein [Halobellus captivus]